MAMINLLVYIALVYIVIMNKVNDKLQCEISLVVKYLVELKYYVLYLRFFFLSYFDRYVCSW